MQNNRSYKIILFLFFIHTFILWISTPVQAGDYIPLAVMTDVNNKEIDLAGYVGKKPIVFWITDLCSVCDEGADNFNDACKMFSPQVAFFIISTADKDTTRAFIERRNITTPVLMGGEDPITIALTDDSGAGLCPVDNLFIVNKAGTVAYRKNLPGTTTKELENLVNKVL